MEKTLTEHQNNQVLSFESAAKDAALLARVKEKDKLAYRQLVDRHFQPIWRLASNILHDVSEAEDVVQEVFLTLWQKADSFTPDQAQFSTWLTRIALNKCIDVTRRRKKMIVSEAVSDVLVDEGMRADKQLSQKQLRQNVLTALGHLSQSQAKTLHQFYFEDKSLKDIARDEALSLDSVKSLLKRGRQNLRSTLNVKQLTS